ncbi:hypothetical protein TruAng_001296 [Truncatella angustata]|nr:hypothetical protein TruAng_001296 [Truncatella angustata]
MLFWLHTNATSATNIGDIWLPMVDGDFIPAPPSRLIAEGRLRQRHDYDEVVICCHSGFQARSGPEPRVPPNRPHLPRRPHDLSADLSRLAARGNDVYLYDWNQTMLDPFLVEAGGAAGMGMIHTSEFAYIFGNLTHYNASGYPFDPMPQDWALEQKESRSWVVGIRSSGSGRYSEGTVMIMTR